jgi:hypothetical protein
MTAALPDLQGDRPRMTAPVPWKDKQRAYESQRDEYRARPGLSQRRYGKPNDPRPTLDEELTSNRYGDFEEETER